MAAPVIRPYRMTATQRQPQPAPFDWFGER
jgi:hypothetical protein